MTLKTLKELILPYSEEDGSMGWISPTDLKQEAITWIKYLLTQKRVSLSERIYSGDLDSIIYGIKHFFNITKEDLK